jgi:hypothetical protein
VVLAVKAYGIARFRARSGIWLLYRSQSRSRLDRVLDLLHTVAEIEIDTLTLIVVEYETWKARTRARQMEKRDE